ncbi:hypothetical protein LTR22_002126 [Elasticomyces elasticus]|nr:hypothetical protein LTR22_002126 [Elasticomyces elasticus]KAK5755511.1 hypothetical protein LTS12_014379 [Elasticomyces elasticus]
MRLGEILNHRYQVTAKLGCGSRSTVWLARDLFRWKWQVAEYVAIKISVAGEVANGDIDTDELHFLQHTTKASKQHPGYEFVRTIRGHFQIRSAAGQHLCLTLEPLRENLAMLKYHFTDNLISVRLLKVIAAMVLNGLDYLHSECGIIHTDLSDNNIIFSFAEKTRRSILEHHSRTEYSDPLPVKRLADRTVYQPHTNFGALIPNIGGAVITDFDASAYGEGNWDRNHDIQPVRLKAPEVLLRAGFSYSADIWNFGALLCGMVEGKPLFDDASQQDRGADIYEALSFARMIAILGPPPQALLDRGERVADFYDEEKRFKFPDLVPKDCSFETFFTRVEGEDKEKLVAFARRMLKWLPEERETAKELVDDEWTQL